MNYYFTWHDDHWLYLSIIVFFLAAIWFDLNILNKTACEVSYRQALKMSGCWIIIAMIANILFYFFCLHVYHSRITDLAHLTTAHQFARTQALAFFSGYLTEKMLALDNLFAFMMIFNTFRIEPKYQRQLLTAGIVITILLRSVLVTMGAYLFQYQWVNRLFGLMLFATGIKLLVNIRHPEKPLAFIGLNWLSAKSCDQHADHGAYWVYRPPRWRATKMWYALWAIELADIIFAFDSVPAVFALTSEPFIVLCTNLLAVMGLRSLYFLLAKAVQQFHRLKYGVAIILIYTGLNMGYLQHAYPNLMTPISNLIVLLFVMFGCFVPSWSTILRFFDLISK